MFDATIVVGSGYKAPIYDELRGPILQNEKLICTHRLEELKESWEVIGCIVMLDSWTYDELRGQLIDWRSLRNHGKSLDAS
jgi:hypothetical protein